MKIRMRRDMASMFHGISNVRRGDIVDVDDDNAQRYIRLRYADAVDDKPKNPEPKPVERAVVDEPVETATAEVVETSESAPVALDDNEDDEVERPKPRPRPARK